MTWQLAHEWQDEDGEQFVLLFDPEVTDRDEDCFWIKQRRQDLLGNEFLGTVEDKGDGVRDLKNSSCIAALAADLLHRRMEEESE